jgi:hypothetical protein
MKLDKKTATRKRYAGTKCVGDGEDVLGCIG